MDKTAILLNGGTDHDVTPLASADTYLVRLLGSEPAMRAVFFLRAMQDEEGRWRVAVLVGSQHVGYLAPDIDSGLLAAVKACEMHEAAVRARGSLTASWEQPGKVDIKVDLSDPEHLLSSPLSDQHSQREAPRETQPPATAPSRPSVEIDLPPVVEEPLEPVATPEPTVELKTPSSLSASFEDAVALIDFDAIPEARPAPSEDSDGLESPAVSDLPAGWTEDYPEWPPPKLDSVTPAAPVPPGNPSPEALLATRSAWVGGEVDESQAAASGWLGSKTPPASKPDAPGEAEDSNPATET